MNVFTVDNPIMNTILPLTMCIPDAMGVLTSLVIVFLPAESVIEVKEAKIGENGSGIISHLILLEKTKQSNGFIPPFSGITANYTWNNTPST